MTKQKEILSQQDSNGVLADVSRREICPSHKQIKLGYLQWFAEAEKRAKKKMKQKQCKICLHWFWKDEM